jgi:hypothetical protein
MTTTKVNLANTVEGILPVANGGTGTSTGVAPGGSTTQVQYNNAGVFAGDSGFVYTGGNVGIGIASPAARLHVSGTYGTTATGGVRLVGIGQTTGDLSPIAFYLQSSNWGTAHQATITAQQVSGTDGGSNLLFGTSTSGGSAPTERMRIDTSGNVGIGNTSPSDYKLLVDGEGSAGGFALKRTGTLTGSASFRLVGSSGSEALNISVNGTEDMRILSSGAISFGTSGTNYGSSGQVLTSNGNAAPSWGSVSLPAGTVLQVVSTNFTSLVTLSSTSLSDVSGFSATITPSSSSNKILIITSVAFGFNNDTYPYVRLNRNGSSIFNGTSAGGNQINVFLAGTGTSTSGTAYRIMQPSKTVLDSPATTSAVTYQIQAASGAGTGYINRQGDQSNNAYIQYPTSTITLMEIKG